MDTADDFPELAQLRAYRADEAIPPVGMLERLRDDLQLTIDAEREPLPVARPARHRSPWRRYAEHRLFRPAMVAGAAAVLVVGIAGVSTSGDATSAGVGAATSATQASTSLFDGTAASLFGTGSDDSVAPVLGTITSVGQTDDVASAVANHDRDDDAYALLKRLPRDPTQLRDTLRSVSHAADGTTAIGGSDQGAFHLAMGLVTDGRLPADLRAAVLRSVGGFDGIDPAAFVRDDLGRTGVLISHFDAGSGVRDQYVLDQSTGVALEQRSFTSEYVDPACPPGTFTGFHIYDDAGNALEPHQLPTLDWPTVVPSCSPATAER